MIGIILVSVLSVAVALSMVCVWDLKREVEGLSEVNDELMAESTKLLGQCDAFVAALEDSEADINALLDRVKAAENMLDDQISLNESLRGALRDAREALDEKSDAEEMDAPMHKWNVCAAGEHYTVEAHVKLADNTYELNDGTQVADFSDVQGVSAVMVD